LAEKFVAFKPSDLEKERADLHKLKAQFVELAKKFEDSTAENAALKRRLDEQLALSAEIEDL